MLRTFKILLIFIFSLWLINTSAELSGREIMEKVQAQGRIHKDQKMDVFMLVKDKKQRERERFFSSSKKYVDNWSLSLMRFYRPANLANTGLLSKLNETTDITDQWLYLPAFRSVKKLSSSEKQNSFMGSDFTNSDVGGRSINIDTHRLLSTNKKYYVVESVPKDKKDNYGSIVYKVHKKIMIATKIDFFDRKSKLIKSLKNQKIAKHKGMYVPINSTMHNPNTGSSTYITVRSINTDVTEAVNFYSTRGLKQ